ncbi:MAG: STAS domain-containing protein [Streptosporangiaceae bacterium]
MTDPELPRQPVIVTVTAEIDKNNSVDVYKQICAAVVPGVGIVIADLTRTRFCGSSGVREIYRAYEQAVQNGTDMRIVIPPGQVMRVMELVGLDRVLPIYASLRAALDPKLPVDN